MNRLKSYLNMLTNERLVPEPLVNMAWQWWEQADRQFFGRLPVPSAALGPDGRLLYTWDKDENHLEVEFSSAEPLTLFHLNRVTGDAAERILGECLKAEDTELFSPFLNSNPKNLPQSGLAAARG